MELRKKYFHSGYFVVSGALNHNILKILCVSNGVRRKEVTDSDEEKMDFNRNLFDKPF